MTGNDTGVYRCLADNTIRPPGMQDVTLTVHFPPYAEPVQSKYGQAQNRMLDIVIECWIQGKSGIQPEFNLNFNDHPNLLYLEIIISC